jgi:hypothetical protein
MIYKGYGLNTYVKRLEELNALNLMSISFQTELSRLKKILLQFREMLL